MTDFPSMKWTNFHFHVQQQNKNQIRKQNKKMAPKWDIVIHPITKRTETRFNRRLSWCKHFLKVQGGLFYNVFLQLLAMQFKICVLNFFFCGPLNPISVIPNPTHYGAVSWWQGIRQVWQCLYLYTYSINSGCRQISSLQTKSSANQKRLLAIRLVF